VTRYRFQALGSDGRRWSGEAEAPTAECLAQRLWAEGSLALRIDLATGAAVTSDGVTTSGRRPPGPRALQLFTRTLATILGAGLELDAALELLGRLLPDAALRDVIKALREEVRAGRSLADALARHPALFPAHYVGMIRAGEASSRLAAVLDELAELQAEALRLRERIRAALVYPIILMVLSIGSILVLLLAVLPRFGELLLETGTPPPAITRLALSASAGLERHGTILLALGFTAIVTMVLVLRRPAVRHLLLELCWRVPLLRAIGRASEAARLLRMLAVLLASGVPLLDALALAVRSIGSPALTRGLDNGLTALRDGAGLATALEHTGRLPELAIQLAALGERSGRLVPLLTEAAAILDRDAQEATQRLLALLVPALTVGAGLIVAVVVSSMLGAVMSAYDVPL
jgi:general secretion pathway protein F